MINPHPPSLRMNRRNTVSVTPAIGARTVAGEMFTDPIRTEANVERECVGRAGVGRLPSPANDHVGRTPLSDSLVIAAAAVSGVPALSQNFFTKTFYLLWNRTHICDNSAPRLQ